MAMQNGSGIRGKLPVQGLHGDCARTGGLYLGSRQGWRSSTVLVKVLLNASTPAWIGKSSNSAQRFQSGEPYFHRCDLAVAESGTYHPIDTKSFFCA